MLFDDPTSPGCCDFLFASVLLEELLYTPLPEPLPSLPPDLRSPSAEPAAALPPRDTRLASAALPPADSAELPTLRTERRRRCSSQPPLLSCHSSETCAEDTDGLSLITLGPARSNTGGRSTYSARWGPVTGQRRARGRGADTRHQCRRRPQRSNGRSA